MYQKSCTLTIAARYFMGGGGGGGGSDILMRKFSKEVPALRSGYNFQTNQLGQFVGNQPLLNLAQQNALGYNQDVGGLPSIINQERLYERQLGGFSNQLGGYRAQVDPTIASGGALPPEAARDVAQSTRGIASAQGAAQGTGALGQELLNRDMYRQQRFNTALQQGQGLVAQQSALTGQRAGLQGQIQGLQTGGLNQLTGTESAETTNFGNVTNPILGYISNLFSGNQQASIAQAQIAAGEAANQKSGTSSAIGGGLSAVGSIAAAY